jgi:fructose-bisphosphate aldolase, class I
MALSNTREILGAQADSLLSHSCKTITKDQIHLPGADFVDRMFAPTNRNTQVLRSLQAIYGHGRLAETGYVSILPVDQGIEHSRQGLRLLPTRFISMGKTL